MADIGPAPSDAANRLADTIKRRIKKGLDASGLNIEPKFSGLAQLIEMYLIVARDEGRQTERERCAKIADDHAAGAKEDRSVWAAEAIAGSIRKGA